MEVLTGLPPDALPGTAPRPEYDPRRCSLRQRELAKHAALTSRDHDRLADGQARVACAASLLRWIWSLTVHGTRWDPRIAAGQISHHHAMAA